MEHLLKKQYDNAINPQGYRNIENIVSRYPNGYFNEKLCRFCEKYFKPKAPSQHYCSTKCSRQGMMSIYLWNTYKISLKMYLYMLNKQKGKCYLCNTKGFIMKKGHGTSLVVDHCHKTGKVRGLLCHNCNRALGMFLDDYNILNKAAEYVKNPPNYPEELLKELPTWLTDKEKLRPKRKHIVFNIYKDIFEKNLTTKEITQKYNITKETKRSIETGKVYKQYFKEYQESATTIRKE